MGIEIDKMNTITTPTIYTIKEKRNIIEYIQRLHKEQQIEIFKILYHDRVKFTENINGIFINFRYVIDDTIKKIDNFIKFCIKKQEELEKKNNDLQLERSYLEENTNFNNN
jgi:hypothetical protein